MADETQQEKSTSKTILDPPKGEPGEVESITIAGQPAKVEEVDNDPEEDPISRINLIIAGVIVLVIAAFVIWLYLPIISVWTGTASTPTLTPLPPTNTPRPTRTATITLTPTIPPTPTITPYAPSAYSIDTKELQPPIPGAPGSVIVLNDDKAVTPDPDFSSPRWSPSDQIVKQLPGITINEPFHATFGRGSVTWQMDVPLAPGMYEVYVLDTLYSSSFHLDFQVRLGQRTLSPMTSTQRVEYWTTTGNPPQVNDLWHSIGLYRVDSSDLLSVSTSWDDRDQFSGPVAIDRVAIVPQTQNNLNLISQLPADRIKYLVDDSAAQFEGAEFLLPVTDTVAWDNSYQKVINPNQKVKVTWKLQDSVPVGTYEIAVFIPEIKGNAQVTYKLLANGRVLERSDGTSEVTNTQGNWKGGQWVSLGAWQVPLVMSPRVQLALQMEIQANTTGEAAADAVAFMTTPAPAATPTP